MHEFEYRCGKKCSIGKKCFIVKTKHPLPAGTVCIKKCKAVKTEIEVPLSRTP